MKLGAYDYLAKPLDRSELADKIRKPLKVGNQVSGTYYLRFYPRTRQFLNFRRRWDPANRWAGSSRRWLLWHLPTSGRLFKEKPEPAKSWWPGPFMRRVSGRKDL